MRQTAISFFSSKGVSLDGVFTSPEDLPAQSPSVIVCHPHPLLGGKMQHPLVTAVCRAAHQQGIASLRFNFRGVGDSQGEFSNGEQEQDDLKAALDIVKLMPGVHRKRLAVVGYSFGASVILRGMKWLRGAGSFVLIAPPIASVRGSRLMNDRRPKLFIAGQRDRVAPSVELQKILDEVRTPLQFTEVPEADHAFEGREAEVADRVAAFLAETLGG